MRIEGGQKREANEDPFVEAWKLYLIYLEVL